MLNAVREYAAVLRPTPHGVGGLKCVINHCMVVFVPSHPSRGGWIEMDDVRYGLLLHLCRPTPHGVGGLKWEYISIVKVGEVVPPLTGWVD